VVADMGSGKPERIGLMPGGAARATPAASASASRMKAGACMISLGRNLYLPSKKNLKNKILNGCSSNTNWFNKEIRKN
jgi:hypothetical protein